jgi:phosphoribosylglycinamide formyltransferase 1
VPARLVVLASGRGTTLQAILDASQQPGFGGRVVAVGAERAGIGALARAASACVECFVVPFADYAERSAWNRAFERALWAHEPDLVLLAGFMRVFDADLVGRFSIVNTHPSLLPAFPGGHALRDALAAGATSTGVTVHWVDAGIDTGPIIVQQRVLIEPGDDEDLLRARVQAAEKPLYVQAIRTLCQEYR